MASRQISKRGHGVGQLFRQPDIVLIGKREKRRRSTKSHAEQGEKTSGGAHAASPGVVDASSSFLAGDKELHVLNGSVGGAVVAPIELPVRVRLCREAGELLD